MTIASQDTLYTLLRIGIVPVMLGSVYLRNRSARRRKAREKAEQRDETRAVRRTVLDLDAAGSEALSTALDRLDAGDIVTSPQGAPLVRWRIVATFADALMAEGRADEAEAVLRGAEDSGDAERWPALTRLAPLCLARGHPDAARAIMSDVADLRLAEMRTAARGDVLYLAELLAREGDDYPDLNDPELDAYGPLRCLRLAGRGDDAKDLADDLIARIDRALAETEADPSGKVDGFSRELLIALRGRLAVLGGLED